MHNMLYNSIYVLNAIAQFNGNRFVSVKPINRDSRTVAKRTIQCETSDRLILLFIIFFFFSSLVQYKLLSFFTKPFEHIISVCTHVVVVEQCVIDLYIGPVFINYICSGT